MGIHLRETGQVFILSVDTSGFWAFLGSNSYISGLSRLFFLFLIKTSPKSTKKSILITRMKSGEEKMGGGRISLKRSSALSFPFVTVTKREHIIPKNCELY
jgi:hypothetical protein